MTIALNDVKMISDMLAAGRDFVDPVESGKNIAEFLSRRKPLSATMNMQANLLYDVIPCLHASQALTPASMFFKVQGQAFECNRGSASFVTEKLSAAVLLACFALSLKTMACLAPIMDL